MLDQGLLSKSDLRLFISLLTGEAVDTIPDPSEDWGAFRGYAEKKVGALGKIYDPIKKRQAKFIDFRQLDYAYGEGGWGCTVS